MAEVDTTSALLPGSVSRVLTAAPRLGRVLGRIVEEWRHTDPNGALLSSGSLAQGTVDKYSDLDLTVVAKPDALESESAAIASSVRSVGRKVATYTAGHIGLPGLRVWLLDVGGGLLKVDVEVLSLDEVGPLSGYVVLADPTGLLADRTPVESEQNGVDLATLVERTCGWMWQTVCWIRRGELFQAATGVDFIRKHAVLPVLATSQQVRLQDYRRLEERLPARLLEELAPTHPASLDRTELSRALTVVIGVLLANLPTDTDAESLRRVLAIAERENAWDIGPVCPTGNRAELSESLERSVCTSRE